jgi:preprotein translocase subunit SecF
MYWSVSFFMGFLTRGGRMKKMKKKLWTLVLSLILLLVSGQGVVRAEAAKNLKIKGDLAVEQVQVDVPLVNAYVYSRDLDLSKVKPKEVRATLAGQKLKVLSMKQQHKTEQGIYYAFLLDVSASIPQADLDAAKEAIERIAKGMRRQDQLAVITFGDDVKVISDGSRPVEKTIRKIRRLKAKDQTTKFYSAMNKLIKVSEKVQNMRRVAVVVSDGIDDTDAGMSQEELEHVLQQSGIAVYGMGIGSNKELARKFGSFLRISGGELYPFTAATANAKLDSLIKRLSSIYRLSMEVTGEVPQGDTVRLSVRIPKAGNFSMKLDSSYWGRATAEQKEEMKEEEKEDKQEEKAAKDEASEEEQPKEERIDKDEISRQKMLVTAAIPAVILLTLLAILVILVYRRKKALKAYYQANGVNLQEEENLKKAIRRKRKN